MRRRELILLLGGAATASPLVAPPQRKADPLIGYLGTTSPGPAVASPLAAFRQGLSETGYVEGQNLAIEYRWAEGSYDRLPALAADLVGRKVDVILAASTAAALPAENATSTIPIVLFSSGDPLFRPHHQSARPAATSPASATSPPS
jgi:putative ABC transport system substrate-binding protein